MGKPGRTARKALLRAGSEQINRIKIFERDKWVCQLCGRKTLKSKIGTWHERAPEVDHIIPVSKKGRHARQNVHCTCRACNSKKGAKIKGQLRMW
jgi:5-methylcytosine-specific restriction endonuclease McrA